MIYQDGRGGASFVKRFAVTAVTRDKEYDLTQGKKSSKVTYFSANPNGEAELVTIFLRQAGSIKKLKFDLDFSDLLIKGRGVKGNIVTKYNIKRIELKEQGVSTLKPRKIWFDDTVQRLNVDGRGELLGEFRGEDRLLVIDQKGIAKTLIPEMTLHFPSDMIVLEKWKPKKPVSAIYWDGEKERYYVKRFLIENSEREDSFISEHPKSFLEVVSTDYRPIAEVVFTKIRGKDQRPNEEVNLEEFIAIKGIKALGNQLTTHKVKQINLLESLPYEEPEPLPTEEIEVVEEENVSPDASAEAPKDEDNDQPTLF